jgi:hypothetical protein
VFMVLITALSLNLSVIPPPRNSLLLLLLFWRVSPSGLFPFRFNLRLCILQRIGMTPWKGDQPVTNTK